MIDFITKLYKADVKHTENVDYRELNSIILLSQRSQVYFQRCIKILNTLFIDTNFSSILYSMIQRYISKVATRLSLIQYIFLYPEKYHKIIQHIQLSFTVGNKKIILQLYKALIQNNDDKCALMLLTHSPKWFPIIYKNIVTGNYGNRTICVLLYI